MATQLIRKLIPKTSYERESLLKAFVLFFLSMEVLLGAIAYLFYERSVQELKEKIFLELKNYSYTFEGERFKLDIVESEKPLPVYELLEDKEGLYILVPVPVSEKDYLKVVYPKEDLKRSLTALRVSALGLFGISSLVAMAMSFIFSLYSLRPLRDALNTIEEVTRDIVHDISTPLTSLEINLKILKRKLGHDEDLERSQRALDQLKRLKENLRPLYEKVTLKVETVDVKALVEEISASLQKVHPEKKLSLDLEKVTLQADKTAVERIVANLLDNAFKHGKSFVRVTLTKGDLIVENDADPPKKLSKLTDRYYKESQRGLGLGLSIVKKLSSELGWKFELRYKDRIFTAKVTFR